MHLNSMKLFTRNSEGTHDQQSQEFYLQHSLPPPLKDILTELIEAHGGKVYPSIDSEEVYILVDDESQDGRALHATYLESPNAHVIRWTFIPYCIAWNRTVEPYEAPNLNQIFVTQNGPLSFFFHHSIAAEEQKRWTLQVYQQGGHIAAQIHTTDVILCARPVSESEALFQTSRSGKRRPIYPWARVEPASWIAQCIDRRHIANRIHIDSRLPRPDSYKARDKSRFAEYLADIDPINLDWTTEDLAHHLCTDLYKWPWSITRSETSWATWYHEKKDLLDKAARKVLERRSENRIAEESQLNPTLTVELGSVSASTQARPNATASHKRKFREEDRGLNGDRGSVMKKARSDKVQIDKHEFQFIDLDPMPPLQMLPLIIDKPNDEPSSGSILPSTPRIPDSVYSSSLPKHTLSPTQDIPLEEQERAAIQDRLPAPMENASSAPVETLPPPISYPSSPPVRSPSSPPVQELSSLPVQLKLKVRASSNNKRPRPTVPPSTLHSFSTNHGHKMEQPAPQIPATPAQPETHRVDSHIPITPVSLNCSRIMQPFVVDKECDEAFKHLPKRYRTILRSLGEKYGAELDEVKYISERENMNFKMVEARLKETHEWMEKWYDEMLL